MVYVLLADGFEEIEALTPVDMMRRAGIEVTTVGVTGKTVTGSHKITVTADVTMDEVEGNTPELIMLPGGQPGTDNLDRESRVHAMIARVCDADGILAAICAAPKILGYSGYLCGKDATCFPGFEKYLIGAHKVDCKAVRDGNIITACGMGAAIPFGAEIISALRSRETADKIVKQILAD